MIKPLFAVLDHGHSSLKIVQIYFDTSTFDLIEKDTKTSLSSLISVIGGTMGLFTGFSILSGVEIVYFAGKLFFSLINKKMTTMEDN